MLGKLLAGRQGIGIAGTHGKSTTTALVAHLLIAAGRDPTVVLGARPMGWSSGGRLGQGPDAVVEACEFRRHFLQLSVDAAIVLGIDHDHFDCFASVADYQQAFREFARQVSPQGLIVANADCRDILFAAPSPGARCVTFDTSAEANSRTVGINHESGVTPSKCCVARGHSARCELSVPGRHNVDNASAAIALAGELGLNPDTIQAAVESFRGSRSSAGNDRHLWRCAGDRRLCSSSHGGCRGDWRGSRNAPQGQAARRIRAPSGLAAGQAPGRVRR